MKRIFAYGLFLLCFVLFAKISNAQCNNADFEGGNFNGWSASHCLSGQLVSPGCYTPNAFLINGLNQGPLNAGPTGTGQFNQWIMNSGNDANLLALSGGTTILPVVWPGGGTYSALLGNTYAHGDAESITYQFVVTPSNTNFTYHYACVLYQGTPGSHPTAAQPYFRIQMVIGTTDTIFCASYEVDGLTAPQIGGFNEVRNSNVYYKPWTSVLIPLDNYVGQTATLTFITRSCAPNGCNGIHYAYAYLDAECAPLQIISSSPTVCQGGNDVLTAPTGAATYSWTGPGIVGPNNQQTVNINQPGPYTVTLTTYGQPPCVFTLDTIIPGNLNALTANFSAPTICVGSPVSFADRSTPQGADSAWSWSFTGATTTTSNLQNPTVTYDTAGTYPVTLTVSSGSCTADTTMNIKVLPIPTANFTAVSPVCAGFNSSIFYTGNATASATYNWNFGGATVANGSGQGPYNVYWTTSGNKSISLTVIDSGCTSLPFTVPVVVNPSPVLTITPHSNICLGDSVPLTASGATTYAWAANASLNRTDTSTVEATPVSSTSYTVTGTSLGCFSIDTTSITVFPIPTATFTAVTPVCTGQNSTVTYTGTAIPSATYTWNFSGGNATPGTGQGPQQVNWSTPGIQNIILNVTQFGCVAPPDTVPVTVYPIPTSMFTATGPVCTGQVSTVTYTGTADSLGTFTWNFAGGVALPGTGIGPQLVTWATAGTKSITLTVSENGCTSPLTTVPVIVNAIPTANFTVTTPLCVGQNGTITYTGTSTNQAIYTWDFSNGNIVSGTGAGPYVVNWSAASVGTQIVSLEVVDHNCVAPPDSLPVVINPIPPSNPGPDTFFCSGGSAPIGGPMTAGYSYLWSPTTGLSSSVSSNPTVSLTTAPDNISSQTYTVTTTSLGCMSSATVIVTVNPVPAPQLTAPPPQCLLGNRFTFKTQGSFLNTASFAWTFGPGANPATSTATTVPVSYGSPGTRAVSFTVSQVGCVNSVTDSVTVYPMPDPDFGPDTLVGCENFEVCFLDSSQGVGPLKYLWNFGDGQTSTDQSPCHIFVAPGLYSVYLKVVSSQQCAYDTTVLNLIKVIADPIAKFTPGAMVIQQPETAIYFTNESLNSLTYLWNFSSVGAINAVIGNSTDVNPTYNFTQYGLYSVKLIAYNALMCADSTQLPITVLPPQNFFIPNAFTPNGDGNNDIFMVYTEEGATLMSFKVFNRWGEKMHDGLYPWDGMWKGKQAPGAVYVYEANIHLIDLNIDILRKGSVTLIR